MMLVSARRQKDKSQRLIALPQALVCSASQQSFSCLPHDPLLGSPRLTPVRWTPVPGLPARDPPFPQLGIVTMLCHFIAMASDER
jgi:hypothetical protein